MADRYWIASASSNWNNPNNWAETSGGASGASVPNNGDTAHFDGNGNNPCRMDLPLLNDTNILVHTGFAAYLDADTDDLDHSVGNIDYPDGPVAGYIKWGGGNWTVSGDCIHNQTTYDDTDYSGLVTLNGIGKDWLPCKAFVSNSFVAWTINGVYDHQYGGSHQKLVTINGSVTLIDGGPITIRGGMTIGPNGTIAANGYELGWDQKLDFSDGPALTVSPGGNIERNVIAINADSGLSLSAPTTFGELLIRASWRSGTINLSNSIIVKRKLTISADYGTLNFSPNGHTIECQGDLNIPASTEGTLTWTKSDNGLIKLTGDKNQTVALRNFSVEDIEIDKPGGEVTFTNSFTTDSLEVKSGTVAFGSTPGTITTVGDWNIEPEANVDPKNLAGWTWNVGGDFYIRGKKDKLTNLLATGSWSMNVTGTANVRYSQVAYSNANKTIDATQSVNLDAGNNTNWSFPAYAIDPNTGQLTVYDPAQFADGQTWEIVVRVRDIAGNTREQAITVGLFAAPEVDWGQLSTNVKLNSPNIVTVKTGGGTASFLNPNIVSALSETSSGTPALLGRSKLGSTALSTPTVQPSSSGETPIEGPTVTSYSAILGKAVLGQTVLGSNLTNSLETADFAFVPCGDITLASSTTVNSLGVKYVSAGSVTTSGLAEYKLGCDASGGIDTSGSSINHLTVIQAATGTLTLAGTAASRSEVVSESTYSASGGIVLAGTSPATTMVSFLATGNVAVAGTSSAKATGQMSQTASGNVTIQGSSTVIATGQMSQSATGKIAIQGSSTVVATGRVSQVAAGAVTIHGASLTNATGQASYLATGTLVLAGTSGVQATGRVSVTATGMITVQGLSLFAATGVAYYTTSGGLRIGGSVTASGNGQMMFQSSGKVSLAGLSNVSATGKASHTGSGNALIAGQAYITGQLAATSNGNVLLQGSSTAKATGKMSYTTIGTVFVNGSATYGVTAYRQISTLQLVITGRVSSGSEFYWKSQGGVVTGGTVDTIVTNKYLFGTSGSINTSGSGEVTAAYIYTAVGNVLAKGTSLSNSSSGYIYSPQGNIHLAGHPSVMVWYKPTSDIVYTGPMRLGGRAIIRGGFTSVAQSGLVVQGTPVVTAAYPTTATGKVTLGGYITLRGNLAAVATGGLITKGNAGIRGNIAQTSSGNVILGGKFTYIPTLRVRSQGTATIAGQAFVTGDYKQTASGKVVTNGRGFIQGNTTFPTAGGVSLAGIGKWRAYLANTATGGLTVSGDGLFRPTLKFVVKSGVRINGTAYSTGDYSFASHGGIQVRGAMRGSNDYSHTATGAVTLAGIGIWRAYLKERAAGNLVLSSETTERIYFRKVSSGSVHTGGYIILRGYFNRETSGSLFTTGKAIWRAFHETTATGTITTSGDAFCKGDYKFTASGKTSISGSSVSKIAVFRQAATGSIYTNGEAFCQGFIAFTGTGLLETSGSIKPEGKFKYAGSGRVTANGAGLRDCILRCRAVGGLVAAGLCSVNTPAFGVWAVLPLVLRSASTFERRFPKTGGLYYVVYEARQEGRLEAVWIKRIRTNHGVKVYIDTWNRAYMENELTDYEGALKLIAQHIPHNQIPAERVEAPHLTIRGGARYSWWKFWNGYAYTTDGLRKNLLEKVCVKDRWILNGVKQYKDTFNRIWLEEELLTEDEARKIYNA